MPVEDKGHVTITEEGTLRVSAELGDSDRDKG